MSINIIGSNDKPLSLIIKNKIHNQIDNIILEYDLLITKYNNQINTTIINKTKFQHLINQLVKLFKFNNINSFIFYINSINNTYDLEKILWNFIEQFNLYTKLDNCLLKIVDKLILLNIINKKELLKLDNNYYLTLLYLFKNLHSIKNPDIEDNLYIINEQINNLNNELNKLKNITIKKYNILLSFDNTLYDDKFMHKLILSLNNHIYIYKIIKSNILNIDNIINIIIENLYKIYIKI